MYEEKNFHIISLTVVDPHYYLLLGEKRTTEISAATIQQIIIKTWTLDMKLKLYIPIRYQKKKDKKV